MGYHGSAAPKGAGGDGGLMQALQAAIDQGSKKLDTAMGPSLTQRGVGGDGL